jgi:uncharacterized protein (DUF2141 family)
MNKSLSLLLLLMLPAGTVRGEATGDPTGSIRVTIGNLRSTTGLVGVALYDAKKGFPDKPERAIHGRSVRADGMCVVVFDDIPYGTYAVSVLHDENSNLKMDKTIIGIPKEGFGTSNNPKIRRGPPSFQESSFPLDRQNVALRIDMNYFFKD